MGALAYLFQLQTKCLKSNDSRHILLLISFDSLDDDLARGELVGLLSFRSFGLCSLLLSILCSSFLSFDG